MKNFYFVFWAVFGLFLLASCGGGKDQTASSEKATETPNPSTTKGEGEGESESEESIPPDQDNKAVVIARSGLSLRREPDGKSKLVTMLPTNAIVQIVEEGPEATIKGKKGTWYRVNFGDKEGFAFGAYLRKGTRLKATSDASAQTEGGGKEETDFSDVIQKGLITAKSGLTLRKAPSIKSEKITVIPSNEEVGVLEFMEDYKEIDGMYGVWCRVRYGRKEGFLFSAFINLSTVAVIAPSGLTLRESPSRNAKKLTVIPNGKEVYLLPPTDPNEELPDNLYSDEEGTWYKVRFGKKEGWAFGEFLAIDMGC
ncbi:MAG: SH3 domain-containing protein [Microscillaceae bacterium]|nr:SH3 domain-containing protein [Microscillaceae bacterium]